MWILITSIGLSGIAVCSNLSGDSRAYCLAIEQRNIGYCYSIQNPNRRQVCRAEIGKNPSYCDRIIEPTAKQFCKVRARRQICYCAGNGIIFSAPVPLAFPIVYPETSEGIQQFIGVERIIQSSRWNQYYEFSDDFWELVGKVLPVADRNSQKLREYMDNKSAAIAEAEKRAE